MIVISDLSEPLELLLLIGLTLLILLLISELTVLMLEVSLELKKLFFQEVKLFILELTNST